MLQVIALAEYRLIEGALGVPLIEAANWSSESTRV